MNKRMKRYGRRFLRALPVVMLPAISGFILGPVEIMLGNTKNFEFSVTHVLPAFCIAALIVVLGLSILLSLIPEKIARYIKSLILGGSICGYIQYMFMNIKLSEADGAPMDWSSLGNFPLINLLVWIAVAALVIFTAIRFKKKWNRYAAWAALALCLIQLSAVAALGTSAIPASDAAEEKKEYQLAGEWQYQVAKDENVIVFVLDTFGTKTLEDVLRTYPDAIDFLNDFTYFTNTDCRYYYTFPSMTHMLTGCEFDFEKNSLVWLEESWKSEKAGLFFGRIKEAGYKTYLHSSQPGYVYGGLGNLLGKFDNVLEGEKIVDVQFACKILLKMSIYRYVPYVLKPHFEVLTQEFDRVVSYTGHERVRFDNADFYAGLKQKGLTVDSETEKAMIIHHLQGMHLPYNTTATGEYLQTSTRTDAGRGTLHIVEDYLNRLKQLNMYDCATIIIAADHGGWNNGNPHSIFFVKKSNERSDTMRTNHAPTSLMDFQATILSLIGREYDEFGKSMFDWKEDDLRERTVYMRGNDENYPPVKGSSFNVYYSYTYTGDREALNEQVNQGNVTVLSATPW